MATQPRPTVPAAAHIALLRRAEAKDAEARGQICYEAFRTIAQAHNFPPDFPQPEVPVQVLSWMFTHPGFYCVVAESGGKIVGSNCLDERTPIAGVGPITVDPGSQNSGLGRQLMQAVPDRAYERKFPGIRLLQSAYQNRSLSLYAKLGFEVREPISTMHGPPIRQTMPGHAVRPARSERCNALCRAVHGHDRGGELADAVAQGTAVVVERAGRITAYRTILGFFGHAVGESNGDLQALIAAAETFAGPGILVPTRNAGLFRWCLEHGLRVVQPMTLLTIGLYNEPRGSYLPSILY